MPAGQPTKYRPEFCERVIEMGKKGKSKTYMAAALEISKDSFENYEKKHAEFFNAVKTAMLYSQKWWEDKLEEATTGENPDANATLFVFNMTNRFKGEWSDKTVVDNNLNMNLTDFK